ncbi:uncharacterized protein LOC107429540 [Ziziphus jujuba]|uniref:Uncharacterized protein LOC107429540 n=1 Tax=Ziziphus jujuba TaxID=326968 RepID=A0A6P4B1P3_ZIZJJ|nr:uncharacterized protein LOC107429540 [Ziziphus jujuba]
MKGGAGAGSSSSSSSSSSWRERESESKVNLMKQIRSHEVALAELNALSSSRAVYQKDGNIFFRTTIQKAVTSEQKQLDLSKAMLEKLNSP